MQICHTWRPFHKQYKFVEIFSTLMTFSFDRSLENLLGHSEELFEPWPCITDACDGQFLVLEVCLMGTTAKRSFRTMAYNSIDQKLD